MEEGPPNITLGGVENLMGQGDEKWTVLEKLHKVSSKEGSHMQMNRPSTSICFLTRSVEYIYLQSRSDVDGRFMCPCDPSLKLTMRGLDLVRDRWPRGGGR